MMTAVCVWDRIAAAGSVSKRWPSSNTAKLMWHVFRNAFAGPTKRFANSLLAASSVEMSTLCVREHGRHVNIVGLDDRDHLSLNVHGRCVFQTAQRQLAVSWAEAAAAVRDASLHLRGKALQLVVCIFLPFSSSFFAMVSPLSPN
jgi:hypothetical protein